MEQFKSFPKSKTVKKKQKPLRKVGKRGKINKQALDMLRLIYAGEPAVCEIRDSHCWGIFQGFAHRHKRSWYYGKEELLASRNQTIKACNQCHSEIEKDADLTEIIFCQLRGPEL